MSRYWNTTLATEEKRLIHNAVLQHVYQSCINAGYNPTGVGHDIIIDYITIEYCDGTLCILFIDGSNLMLHDCYGSFGEVNIADPDFMNVLMHKIATITNPIPQYKYGRD